MNAPGGSPFEPNPVPEPAAPGPAEPATSGAPEPAAPDAAGGASAPPPPPGPGVPPPFTAPPTDRNRRGLWIGLGVGALVLVLCCVGGLAGFGLLAVGTSRQIQANATEVVRDYLNALESGDYDAAYSYVCTEVKDRVTASEFAEQQRARPRPVSYVIHQVQIGNAVIVPADVRYEDGSTIRRSFELVQESGGRELRICRGT